MEYPSYTRMGWLRLLELEWLNCTWQTREISILGWMLVSPTLNKRKLPWEYSIFPSSGKSCSCSSTWQREMANHHVMFFHDRVSFTGKYNEGSDTITDTLESGTRYYSLFIINLWLVRIQTSPINRFRHYPSFKRIGINLGLLCGRRSSAPYSQILPCGSSCAIHPQV